MYHLTQTKSGVFLLPGAIIERLLQMLVLSLEIKAGNPESIAIHRLCNIMAPDLIEFI